MCTVKAHNCKNDSKLIKWDLWDLAGSLQQYSLNSTQFALSQLSGLMNLIGELVTINLYINRKFLPIPTRLTPSKLSVVQRIFKWLIKSDQMHTIFVWSSLTLTNTTQ